MCHSSINFGAVDVEGTGDKDPIMHKRIGAVMPISRSKLELFLDGDPRGWGRRPEVDYLIEWWRRGESNPRPVGYESTALTI
jgi:hypothetical protein